MRLNKENKLLIIFATAFIILGIALSIGIQRINRNSFAKKYFETATDYKMETFEDGLIERKITFYGKAKKVVGTLYFVSGEIEGIPGSDGFLSYAILMDGSGYIIKIDELENNHTIDQGDTFYNVYLEQLANLKSKNVNHLKIDAVTGSTVSYNLIKNFFNAVRNSEGLDDFVVDEGPETDYYEELFAGYDEIVLDDTFVATTIITKKEIIKDDSGNTMGYTYTATGKADIPGKKDAVITLLVGIDNDGKVKGVEVLTVEHTPGFVAPHLDVLAGMKNIDLNNLKLDDTAEATVSFNLIKSLLDAIKEAEGL